MPLGLELVTITEDKKTQLRKSGRSVQTERERWDVSVSGYVAPKDLDLGRKHHIDLAAAAYHEFCEEIGQLNADPSDITFLGVHFNKDSGATDVLASWPVHATSRQLASLINRKYRREQVQFRTGERAIERFVHDTENMFLEFNAKSCFEAVHGLGADLMPEALACLRRAIEHHCS